MTIDLNLSLVLSRKNFLKNPNFAVIQGTASGAIANSLALPTASLGYLGETEWWLAASGGTPAYAFSQLNENVTITGAAGTTAIHLGQRIESRDTNRLKSKTVTLSCEISNSLLTTVTWELFNPTTTNDIHGTVATSTQTLIATGTFTVNSTLTRYSATITLPVGVLRGIGFRLRVGAQTSGTWVVSRLQLEEGSIATNFSCDTFLMESQKCQRYYKIARSSIRNIAAAVGAIAANEISWDLFAVPISTMRATVSERSNVDGAYPQLSNLSTTGATATIVSVAAGDFYDNGRIWDLYSHIP